MRRGMTAASCFSAFSASSFMVAIEFRLKVAYSCFPNSPFWYSLQTQWSLAHSSSF